MSLKISEWEPGTGIYLYFCPGCKMDHAFHSKKKNSLGSIWKWNHDFERPTVSPSMNGIGYKEGGQIEWHCHHRIIDGNIKYFDDCTHELKGKTISMVDRI